jgi:Flp pilus assembly protein TadB
MSRRAIMRAADAEGRLQTEELEERLEAVFAARTYGELEALTSDLPREPAPRSHGHRSLPIPWPAAVLAFMILMPMVVAVAVAAVVLVASFVAVWLVVAAIVMWLFGHRVRFHGPRYYGRYYSRTWHHQASAGRWRA